VQTVHLFSSLNSARVEPFHSRGTPPPRTCKSNWTYRGIFIPPWQPNEGFFCPVSTPSPQLVVLPFFFPSAACSSDRAPIMARFYEVSAEKDFNPLFVSPSIPCKERRGFVNLELVTPKPLLNSNNLNFTPQPFFSPHSFLWPQGEPFCSSPPFMHILYPPVFHRFPLTYNSYEIFFFALLSYPTPSPPISEG